jgi:hypothetical protein
MIIVQRQQTFYWPQNRGFFLLIAKISESRLLLRLPPICFAYNWLCGFKSIFSLWAIANIDLIINRACWVHMSVVTEQVPSVPYRYLQYLTGIFSTLQVPSVPFMYLSCTFSTIQVPSVPYRYLQYLTVPSVPYRYLLYLQYHTCTFSTIQVPSVPYRYL